MRYLSLLIVATMVLLLGSDRVLAGPLGLFGANRYSVSASGCANGSCPTSTSVTITANSTVQPKQPIPTTVSPVPVAADSCASCASTSASRTSIRMRIVERHHIFPLRKASACN